MSSINISCCYLINFPCFLWLKHNTLFIYSQFPIVLKKTRDLYKFAKDPVLQRMADLDIIICKGCKWTELCQCCKKASAKTASVFHKTNVIVNTFIQIIDCESTRYHLEGFSCHETKPDIAIRSHQNSCQRTKI